MVDTVWEWVLFNLFVVVMLVLDLMVFHRKPHVVKTREAVGWSLFWIALALMFNGLIHYWHGPKAAMEFFTGYVLEKSLSVDNLFVFVLLFSYFRVKPEYQHRVLFWGILGAIIMRAVFIFAGVALVNRFNWVFFVFGAFLILTGVKMAIKSEGQGDPEKKLVLRLARKMFRITPDFVGQKFFTRIDGKLFATPLFVVLLIVETTDVIFATDSIPAILGITRDTFIIYSSNVFAILGLRALYFALAGMMESFHLLHYGLATILVFIGAKMLLEASEHYPQLGLPHYHIAISSSLGVIATVLVLSVSASLLFPKKAVAKQG